jgi:LemA protein
MYILIGILVLFFLVAIGMYNGLVGKKNMCENSFYTIDVYLKKRADLIPQLVETVKGYMQHEQELLQKLTQLRAEALRAKDGSKEEVEENISLAMGKLLIVSEKYPDLKANQNFLLLQRTINEMEEQLAAARRTFNAAIKTYNDSVEKFPSNLMANMMGYTRKDFFNIDDVRELVSKRPEITI